MAVTAGLSLLMLVTLPVAARIHTVYYENYGGRVKMNPNYTETIHNITWRYNGDFLIQYSTAYPNRGVKFTSPFKNRGNLNLTTGTLIVFALGEDEGGNFTVEINGKVLPITFNSVGINNLAKYPVDVLVMPKGCSKQTSNNCTLVCGEQFKGAEPVQYFWKEGKTGEWKMGDKTLSILFTEETKELSDYSCKVKNPVSEKRSDQEEKPIIEEYEIDEEIEKPIVEEIEIDPREEQTLVESSSGPDPMPAVLLVAVLAVGAAVVV